jgi:hypothetical protein
MVGGVAFECRVLVGRLRGRRRMLGEEWQAEEPGSKQQRRQGTHAEIICVARKTGKG